jgi:hypothetical protein
MILGINLFVGGPGMMLTEVQDLLEFDAPERRPIV